MWVSGLDACEEAAHRGVRAGKAVATYQGAVDGRALDTLTPPTRDALAMRLSQRGDRGLCAHQTQVHGKLGVAGQGRGNVEPARRLGGAAKLPANPPAKARRALYALQQIRTLYAIERRLRDKPPDYRHLARQTESVAVLDKLRAWLDDTIDNVPPSTPLGKAMSYLHNQWKGLVRFCDDGRYGIDTNPIENAIRPFVVGRRNWLFADTVAGANPSARLYSLIECAKANALEPYAYLRHVFTELPKAQSLAEVEALLPTRLDPAALAPDSLQESFLAARQ